MPDPGSDDTERLHRRRRFGLWLSPVAIALLVAGIASAGAEGTLGALGLVALAQGIGLAVAVVWLGMGHNPLSKP